MGWQITIFLWIFLELLLCNLKIFAITPLDPSSMVQNFCRKISLVELESVKKGRKSLDEIVFVSFQEENIASTNNGFISMNLYEKLITRNYSITILGNHWESDLVKLRLNNNLSFKLPIFNENSRYVISRDSENIFDLQEGQYFPNIFSCKFCSNENHDRDDCLMCSSEFVSVKDILNCEINNDIYLKRHCDFVMNNILDIVGLFRAGNLCYKVISSNTEEELNTKYSLKSKKLHSETQGSGFWYRYYKFTAVSVRTPAQANCVQFSELVMMYNSARVDYSRASASNPGGSYPNGKGPSVSIDNNYNTVWLDFNFGSLIIDFGAPTLTNQYKYITGSDFPERDPVSWVLYGSNDNTNWTPLDSRSSVTISTSANSIVGPFDMLLMPSTQPKLTLTLTEPSAQPTNQPTSLPSSQPTNPTSEPSSQPTNPTSLPSSQPTWQPSSQPTSEPSTPTSQPSSQPTSPTSSPSCQPSAGPTTLPSSQPTIQPSAEPTNPTSQPSSGPTSQPSSFPSLQPSAVPSRSPTSQPTAIPSDQPSAQPSAQPTSIPTQPSAQPSSNPTNPSGRPTMQPSCQPTSRPSHQPTTTPSHYPSQFPTSHPSSQPSRQPSQQPSGQPSTQPSIQPSMQPIPRPSSLPSSQPSIQPIPRPSSLPSNQPSNQPSSSPSRQPSTKPSMVPTSQPSSQPTMHPSNVPSSHPSSQPFSVPSGQPSCQPSMVPTSQPSSQPTMHPSSVPSSHPSSQPFSAPSGQPSCQPSMVPTSQPSKQPTMQPSSVPSSHPSSQPFSVPSGQPSTKPSMVPTSQPSNQPSSSPSRQPSTKPSMVPTSQPSNQPTMQPSSVPSSHPSSQPFSVPSGQPSTKPSMVPTSQPSNQPFSAPSGQPSTKPSTIPTSQPSSQPTMHPSSVPSSHPSSQPFSVPSGQPSCQPSMVPTSQPSSQPTMHPSNVPSSHPSSQPFSAPSGQPSCQPSMVPTSQPSNQPTMQPSSVPSSHPSSQPFSVPSGQPSCQPSMVPTSQPSNQPSSIPSRQPSTKPSTIPTSQPSSQPTMHPSSVPSSHPSSQPFSVPSGQPSCQPSMLPTSQPSSHPTMLPSNVPSSHPSSQPFSAPSGHPSIHPLEIPTSQPSNQPSTIPTLLPNTHPSCQPSASPSMQPSTQPSLHPSGQPSLLPSSQPSSSPSRASFNWNILVDQNLDTDIPIDGDLEEYCAEDSWLKSQTRSGRCSLRIALKFCLFRAPWSLLDLKSCRIYLKSNSVIKINESLSSLDLFWSNSHEISDHDFPVRTLVPYSVHIIIDGSNSKIISNSSSGCVLCVGRYQNRSETTEKLVSSWQYSSSLAIKNLEFIASSFHSLVPSNGSCIAVRSISELTLENVAIINFSALEFGGGLFLSNISRVELINFKLLNARSYNGGGMYIVDSGILSIESSYFYNNTASNIGGSIFAERISSMSIVSSKFILSSAGSFGGGVAIDSSEQIFFNKNLYLENFGKYGSSLSLGRCRKWSVTNNSFVRNSALIAGSVYWITKQMTGPLQEILVHNVFLNNQAGVYGDDVATNMYRLKPTPSTFLITNYLSGTYPINCSVHVVDFYDQIVRSESNIFVNVWVSPLKAYCGVNPGKMIGETSALLIDGKSSFQELGSSCYPGGSANITFTASLSVISSLFPIYHAVLDEVDLWKDKHYRKYQSNDASVYFRRCLRGEIYDLYTPSKSTCSLCLNSFSLDDNTGEYATSCQVCPSLAFYCIGYSIELPSGVWRCCIDSAATLYCTLPNACVGGNGSGDSLCNIGYYGPQCGICETGYYLSSMMQCLPCTNSGLLYFGQVLLWCLLGIAIVGGPIMLIFRKRLSSVIDEDKNGDNDIQVETDIYHASSYKKIFFLSSSRLKIVFSTYQIVASSFPTKLNVGAMGAIIGVFGIFEADFSTIIPMRCFRSYNFLDRLKAATLFPLIVLFCGSVIGVVFEYTLVVCSSSQECPHVVVAKFWNGLLSVFLVVSYYILPSISLKIFQLFDCIQVPEAGGYRLLLRNDVSIDCNSNLYLQNRTFGLLMLFLYPIGIPFFYFLLLRNYSLVLANRERLQYSQYSKFIRKTQSFVSQERGYNRIVSESNVVQRVRAMNFLFSSYSSRYWYWEVVEVWKRLLLMSMIMSFMQSDVVRTVVNIVVGMTFYKLYSLCNPLLSNADNIINNLGSFQVVIVYFTILISLQDGLHAVPNNQMIVNIVVIIANSLLGMANLYYGFKDSEDTKNCNKDDCQMKPKIIQENNEDEIDMPLFSLATSPQIWRTILSSTSCKDLSLFQSVLFQVLFIRRAKPSLAQVVFVDDSRNWTAETILKYMRFTRTKMVRFSTDELKLRSIFQSPYGNTYDNADVNDNELQNGRVDLPSYESYGAFEECSLDGMTDDSEVDSLFVNGKGLGDRCNSCDKVSSSCFRGGNYRVDIVDAFPVPLNGLNKFQFIFPFDEDMESTDYYYYDPSLLPMNPCTLSASNDSSSCC